jgi:glycosyltransferase involved in cell wall biosynthesis
MKVCYFGTYRDEYSRNQIMINGLQKVGIEVLICHENLWHGITDRVDTVSGGWKKITFWLRLICVYSKLMFRYMKISDHDVVIVGYPGQLDVFFARILCRFRKKPLVWDIFMSIYLISMERGLEEKNRKSLKLLRWLEKKSVRTPDLLILDTPQYVQWFEKTHEISPDRFRLVPTGADEQVYHPINLPSKKDGVLKILYFGTYIPNHHVETIISAANLLKTQSQIHFELIGEGPDKAKCEKLALQYALPNVEFINWLDEKELVNRIDSCDICLGAFGLTPQSMMTIQNKIYIGLAMAKPVITGDSDAVRTEFTNLEHLFLCKRVDPESLANAIVTLGNDPLLREKLSVNGNKIFYEKYCISAIGKTFKKHLDEIL